MLKKIDEKIFCVMKKNNIKEICQKRSWRKNIGFKVFSFDQKVIRR